MAATTATSSCLSFPLSPRKPPPSHKLFPLTKQLFLRSNYRTISLSVSPRSVSSPETGVVEEEAEAEAAAAEEEDEESGTPPDDVISSISDSLPPLTSVGGCKSCGRGEIERGCNGEGRIQGGIATVPGFGWWPIKAYRPCPAYVASGGRYRRSGQSMDEVVSGRGVRDSSDGANDVARSRKKKEGPRNFKR